MNKLSKTLSALLVALFLLPMAPMVLANGMQANASGLLKISRSAIGKTQTVNVGLNKSVVIDLPGDAHDILVANPDVADAVTRTSRRIYVFAKQVGSTNIFIFDNAGNQLLSIDLRIERDVAGLQENLSRFIPGSDIQIEVINDNIVLTGTVPTPQASARAVQLARAFLTGGEATTNQFNDDASDVGDGSIIFFGSEDRRESQIVNLLRIDGEDQVHLKVTIAEIQRTIVKQLGIDITAAGLSVGNLSAGFAGDSPFGLGKLNSRSNQSFGYTGSGGESIDGIIRALNQAGVMRTLAEPSLTAISGETATFAVGGEYSIPSEGSREVDDNGNLTEEISFEQLEYGVSLAFRPVVLGPGRISMRIRTEVSEPTTEGSATALSGGSRFATGAVVRPGIRRRQAETTVELPSGGSMVLAGLLKDDVRQAASGFPGLKDVPVLGALFRSRDFQRYETELVVIATPYLVRPVARQKLSRPDDNFHPTNDGAGNFLGRLNRVYGQVEGELPAGRYHGNAGFIFK